MRSNQPLFQLNQLLRIQQMIRQPLLTVRLLYFALKDENSFQDLRADLHKFEQTPQIEQ